MEGFREWCETVDVDQSRDTQIFRFGFNFKQKAVDRDRWDWHWLLQDLGRQKEAESQRRRTSH